MKILEYVRLGGLDGVFDESSTDWSLERIADTYELMASLLNASDVSRSAAFVAATAQQILARRQRVEDDNFIGEIINYF